MVPIEHGLIYYGYLFVLVGTVVEGDATLLTASFLAHRGYFSLTWVLAIAAISTIASNQLYFVLGRKKGRLWLESRAGANPRLRKVFSWTRNRGGLLLLASRFMIGFRTIIPVVCGATGMAPGSFLFWNASGAVAWTLIFGAAGFLSGQLLTVLVDDFRRYEKAAALVIAVAACSLIAWKTKGRDWLDLITLRRSPGR